MFEVGGEGTNKYYRAFLYETKIESANSLLVSFLFLINP